MSGKSETDINGRLPSRDEQELIREQNAASCRASVNRAADGAKARGLTESALKKLLQD